MGITQSEIARITGFSRQTVSLAINHPEKLDTETVKHIMDVIKETGYVPNESARNFKKGRTGVIGVVFRYYSQYDFESPYLSQTMKGVVEACGTSGCGVQFIPLQTGEITFDLFHELFRSRKVDGIIYMSYRHDRDQDIFKKLIEKGLPCVVFSREGNQNMVDVDFRQGIRTAVSRLVDSGHKRICYMGGGPDMDFNKVKWNAYQEICSENGVILPPRLQYHSVWNLGGGRSATISLLQDGVKFDAILAAEGDLLAIGAMQVLNERGVGVGPQCALISIEGSLYSRSVQPVISSMVAKYDIRALRAVNMLMSLIENGGFQERELIPMEYQPGGTTQHQ
jgi:DNA-binding LacI/PurR family transcriptional regulator